MPSTPSDAAECTCTAVSPAAQHVVGSPEGSPETLASSSQAILTRG